MVDVPAVMPVTRPLAEPTVATNGVLLIHVPPLTASVNKVVPSTQITAVPDMAEGPVVTVTDLVAAQPELIV